MKQVRRQYETFCTQLDESVSGDLSNFTWNYRIQEWINTIENKQVNVIYGTWIS